MSKMSEAQYELIQDCKEKKITARSARSTRTHCGKAGGVKLPSDYLSAKERKKLNGVCKSYRMNEPMTWEEFKAMPDDLKKEYIKGLRQKYNVPDNELAKMFGVSGYPVFKCFEELGLGQGKNGRKRTWDSAGFYTWKNKDNVEEVEHASLEDNVRKASEILGKEFEAARMENKSESEWVNNPPIAIPIEPSSITPLTPTGIAPNNGTLTFEGTANDILLSLQGILQNRYVRLTVQWSVVDENVGLPPMKIDTDALAKAGKIIDYAVMNEQRKKALGTKG